MHRFHPSSFRLSALALTLLGACALGHTADLAVSGNDGKYQRVQGRDTFLSPPPADTITVLDLSIQPPKVLHSVDVENGIQGPPQAVAISPDGGLVLVGAPTRYDAEKKSLVFDNFLQVVNLKSSPPKISKIDLGTHPQGIAINRAGTLALVANTNGTVSVFRITQQTLEPLSTLTIGKKRLAGVSFTHDGAHALVSLRDEQGVAVLDVQDNTITDSGQRLSSGVAPYTIDVSGDGHWAIVGNVGLAGLPGYSGTLAGDSDSITLIDVSRKPFRTVDYIPTPSLPEGVAISPDGRWIAAAAMDGSNLTTDNAGRREKGKVVLYALKDGKASKVSELAGGEAMQGAVFSADSQRLLVQFNVERQLAVFDIKDGSLHDTGQRLPLSAGPSSLRTAPR